MDVLKKGVKTEFNVLLFIRFVQYIKAINKRN